MMRILLVALLGMVLASGCAGTGGDGGTGGAAGVDGGIGGSGGALACDQMPALGGELGGQCPGDTMECNGNQACLQQQDFVVGGPNDPIVDYPPGEDESFTVSEFPGSYCTAALPPSWPATQCAGANAEACAQECGLCTVAFTDADICLGGCRAETNTNSVCREGYECDLLFEVCDSGCSSDDDCRVFREDTNGNGELEPWDPINMTGDRLVYDTESTYECNGDTYRCEHPGTPGAQAGDACEDNQECEANGTCLDEEFLGFPGGYCSKIRCDVDPCAGDGVCASLDLGVPLCAESCQVGTGAVPGDASTYLGNTQGCREAYTCFWREVADDPTGACVPGVFNDVTENNIGDDCTDATECYSPFGQGACGDADFACSLTGEPPGACQVGFGCTVLDCAAPGIPGDVCGTEGECVLTAAGISLCVARCSAAENCLPGAACADLDADPLTLDTVCLPFCVDSSECRTGEICNNLGECAPAP